MTNVLPDRFRDRVAVVTGAASGIGAAVARRLIAEGGRVVGGDVNGDGLAAMAAELGDGFAPVDCDVTDEAAVAAMVERAVADFGRLDLGFNVAGASVPGPIVELSEADWDATVDLCLKGVFLALKHEARQLIAQGGGGAIVNVASLNSLVPMFFGAAYSSAKAGVAMLGQQGALELAEFGIRVNTISPGLTATPLVDRVTSHRGAYDAYMARIPMKRPGTPEDMAASALFLASDDAAYITGVNLVVDGGWAQTGYPDLRPMLTEILASMAEPTDG